MTSKIFKAIFTVAASMLLVSFVVITGIIYDYFGNIQNEQLADELELAAVSVTNEKIDYLKSIKTDRYRLTWVSADGTVIYDTDTGSDKLQNHADREEIKSALKNGTGKSTRYSSTLMEKTNYYAKRLTDGTVLRISSSYATVWLLLLGMLQPIIIVLLTSLALSGLLAHYSSKKIVKSLNNLNLDDPLENETYEELSPLLNRIEKQRREISNQISLLRQKTDEFNQITQSMTEGLILLDNHGTILSINPAAQKIFNTDKNSVGHDFLSIDRNPNMSTAIQKAMELGHSEIRSQHNGRLHQFDISRIVSADETIGCVLLAFDITEQEFAERNRREFTANVSHELKTPLQGIIGSSELIESGMVKSEDLKRFVGHIHKEAERMVTLIEDIIRLSQLDEGEPLPFEEVDLNELANEAVSNLKNMAENKNITITAMPGKATVNGVRRLIYEIIFNLCDNAIKYNNPGGTVEISVSSNENNATVSVKDNGIGIAPKHQPRIFERFYRVDKSHSKESGGTGLGLSIVKHAVLYHHGKIDIESQPDVGTKITVTLPIENNK